MEKNNELLDPKYLTNEELTDCYKAADIEENKCRKKGDNFSTIATPIYMIGIALFSVGTAMQYTGNPFVLLYLASSGIVGSSCFFHFKSYTNRKKVLHWSSQKYLYESEFRNRKMRVPY